MNAEDAIRAYFGDSTSPTAPKVREYGWIKENEIAYEFSEGREEEGKELVGYRRRELIKVRTVTVVAKVDDEWVRLHDACETFWGENAEERAKRHLRVLGEEYNEE